MTEHTCERRYRDVGGEPRTLREMIAVDAEWAANRIRRCEDLEAVAQSIEDTHVVSGIGYAHVLLEGQRLKYNENGQSLQAAVITELLTLLTEQAKYIMDRHRLKTTPGEREMAALREDAARYRWLRERDLDTIHRGGVFAGQTPENFVLAGEDLDIAVDQARFGAGEETKNG